MKRVSVFQVTVEAGHALIVSNQWKSITVYLNEAQVRSLSTYVANRVYKGTATVRPFPASLGWVAEYTK